MKTLRSMLMRILSQPTAPFRESWVNAEILKICDEWSVKTFTDDFGNIWVNASSMKDLKKAKLVMVAHTDHPGIVINKFEKKGSKVYAHGQWLGGGPKNITGHSVTIFSHYDSNFSFEGIVKAHTDGTRGPDKVICEIKTHSTILTSSKSFKQFGPWGACLDYREHGVRNGVIEKDGYIHTKAADDVCGVAALISGLLRSKSKNKDVVILFSRAEESGFHGTLDVLEKKILDPKKTAMISIETSSRLHGAIPGGGPVVRLGDRLSVFDSAFVKWIEYRALEVASKNKGFTFQKKLMDGGSCEASAFSCYGFKVAGISTPLLNYHNMFLPMALLMGKKIKSKAVENPHPEIVNFSDVDKLASLIAEVIDSYPKKIEHLSTHHTFKFFKESLVKHFKKEIKKYT